MISWPAYGGEDGRSIYLRNGFPGLNSLDPIPFFVLTFALLCLVTRLRAFLMDEPVAGLRMDADFRLADRISVLVYGEIVATGSPYEIRADAAVRSAYLGEETR